MTTEFVYSESDDTRLVSILNPEEVVVFPKKIKEIADGSEASSPFSSCRSIVTEIKFEAESCASYIGKYCFSCTTRLTKADFSNCLKLTSISSRMFYKSSIKEIILPENGMLKTLCSGAFAKSYLTALKIPDSVEKIESDVIEYNGVFRECYRLTTVEISRTSRMTYIGTAIGQYSVIKSFFVPKGVETIQDGAFNLMRSLENLTVDDSNEHYLSIDNIIYSHDKTNLKSCACNKQTPIVLEKEVIRIAPDSLRGCNIRGSFTVPEGVTSLYCNTFSYTLFSDIILPSTLKYVEYACFIEASMKHIIIPANTSIIYGKAFWSCYSLKKVTFIDPLKTLELKDEAFYNCINLISIIIPKENIMMNIDKAFSGCPKLSKIYYLMKYFPTKRTDTVSRNIRYYAKIISKTDTEEHECGDVEVDSYSSFCRINFHTKQRGFNNKINLISLSIILLSY